MTRIIRVFPRRTEGTPDDSFAFTSMQPPYTLPEVDEIHISIAFTWDMPMAEIQAEAWRAVGVPVKMGGPAFNQPGGEFTPGLYTKRGIVITSRGCPNHCWFCAVPKREKGLRELAIKDGWIVTDDNLLACSDGHIRAVFEMLKRQPQKPTFKGGLEAKLLKPWHVDLLREAKTERAYFAYDTPDDYEPLIEAGKLLRAGGITEASNIASCYVLIGYHGDTFDKAQKRLTDTVKAGFFPYAMLYMDEKGKREPSWAQFQREWVIPQIVGAKAREIRREDTASA